MPTFTAIALDRLLEPGASKSIDESTPNLRPPHVKHPNSKLEKVNGKSTRERKIPRPQISPALYATPKATPVPDSPSSFPPSPYIVNHKGRGPRLLKSFSQDDVSARKKTLNEEKADGKTEDTEARAADLTKSNSIVFPIAETIMKEDVNGSGVRLISVDGVHDDPVKEGDLDRADDVELANGQMEVECRNRGPKSSNPSNDFIKESSAKLVVVNSDREVESEDFYDPQESMSFTSSTEGEDCAGLESSVKIATPAGEFYDAWEDLSSESGLQASVPDIESELREIRLSLLMEIEKRKQVEDTLNNMRSHWESIREQLASHGLTLPAYPTVAAEGEGFDIDPAEELSQQLNIARFVSDSIGRGIAKAELGMEMEAQIESKNFEIARLLDRLHYYEAVNREMSHRNQEAVEMSRRERQRRKRRQKWVWGSIAATITLGTAALALSYLPTAKGSSSTNGYQIPELESAGK